MVERTVAKVHKIFRKNMGFVDQSDAKATVMALTSEITPKWYTKQLAFLEETAVSNAHCNYNLDAASRSQDAEYFSD